MVFRALRVLGLIGAFWLVAGCGVHLEQRDMPAPRRADYNAKFFYRHNAIYRGGAGIHFAHAKQHDLLQLTPLKHHHEVDLAFAGEAQNWFFDPPRIEPHMFYYGPHVGQAMWSLYQAIDWTHVHHEQTYDILSDPGIPWHKKAAVTRAAVNFYLDRLDTARSPAPLDVTMRRAGTMMKPYFTVYRNYYPESSLFFFFAHWWHPAIYEAQILAGNDWEQDYAVKQAHALSARVAVNAPGRMLLSREMMPRYSRMSPESANIFDNLHMLHGIAYDILAYEGWSVEQKRKELYRVIDAMSEKPGDRELARKFPLPYPDMDPRVYAHWMRTYEGSMNRIMQEMLREMWPLMSPDGSQEPPADVMAQLKKKLLPGMQEGELAGSLHDALKKMVPGLKMDREGMKPGNAPKKMVAAMLQGYWRKYRNLEPVPPLPMQSEPDLPPVPLTLEKEKRMLARAKRMQQEQAP